MLIVGMLVALISLPLVHRAPVDGAATVTYQLRYCPPEVALSDPDLPSLCSLSQRPLVDGVPFDDREFILRLDVRNNSAHVRDVTLSVRPYFVPRIAVLRAGSDAPLLLHVGGAMLAERSGVLGGHVFTLSLVPGDNVYLVQIEATDLTHLSFTVDDSLRLSGLALPEIGVAVHLGMLAALLVLGVIATVLRPSTVHYRLLLFIAAIVLSVLVGSGLLPQLTGLIPAAWYGTVFLVLVIVRIASWGWLYQALLEPNLPARWYRYGALGLHGVAALAVLLVFLDDHALVRVLLLFLGMAVPALHLVAAIVARTSDTVLRLALIASLALYLLLHAVALLFISGATGTDDTPLVISRVLDLLVPMLAMAVVFMRNQATDRQLALAEQALARKQAQLDAEIATQRDRQLLIDMLTHEIKNPLASIRLASHGLRGQVPDEQTGAQRRFHNIDRSVATIDQIIERCNLSNRLESSDDPLQLDEEDLPALLARAVADTAQPERIHCRIAEMEPVLTDPELLEVVVGNLLDNALKYAAPQTPVELEAYASIGSAKPVWGVRVSNQVVEALRPDPDRVFDRFYRHEEARRLGGSGLGMTLSKQIVERLGGMITCRLDAESVVFTVEFPVVTHG